MSKYVVPRKRVCEHCGKSYELIWTNMKRRFCSRSCGQRARKDTHTRFRKGMQAWNKGLTGFRDGHEVTLETRKKIGISNRKHNPKSKTADLLRRNVAFKLWRKMVFERDNYICRGCGDMSVRGHRIEIHPHHIIPFAEIMSFAGIRSLVDGLRCSQLWDVSNGITLCAACHRAKHQGISFTGKKAVLLEGA